MIQFGGGFLGRRCRRNPQAFGNSTFWIENRDNISEFEVETFEVTEVVFETQIRLRGRRPTVCPLEAYRVII